MSLICTHPADANPTHPATTHFSHSHKQRNRNTGREEAASPFEVQVYHRHPRPRDDLEIAPPSPVTLAGGSSR